MELNPKQQVKRLIESSQDILLFGHTHVDGDALGSCLAMAMLLKKLGKNPVIIVEDPIPESYLFLPGMEHITSQISGGKDFIISINTSNASVQHVNHERKEDHLEITISPKLGTFLPEDVTFGDGKPKFDLIFVLDSSNLELTGKTYKEYPDLFYETPIINIDHHASNEYFGKVNIVDITATSTAEIILSLVESIENDKPLMDADIATCLLNGVITDTGSFQNANTTPKAFSIAAQLLAAGARQQEIIKHVYKTHPLTTLKLWGKALAKLQYNEEAKMVWSSLSREDFKESNAQEHETSGVIDELLSSAPNADVVMLLKEGDGVVRGSLRSIKKTIDVAKIASVFSGGGHKRASGFKLVNTTLEEAISTVIPTMEKILSNYPDSLTQYHKDKVKKNATSNVEKTESPIKTPEKNKDATPQEKKEITPSQNPEQQTSDKIISVSNHKPVTLDISSDVSSEEQNNNSLPNSKDTELDSPKTSN